jgi:putative acetyltransferase
MVSTDLESRLSVMLPDRQRQGIGSMLVKAGIDELCERNCPFIIVLGHPEYYPRFGFVPAARHGLSCQWDGIPDEAFMVLILDEISMAGVSGVARYRDEFAEAM